ncbi:nicastrin-like [Dermatophagoides pteronyssinus]|uniref:nicastrin-like n=1 Tax=Dermatophagoides pteronyssinus TaxID=6956 RepID=UPI003F680B6F
MMMKSIKSLLFSKSFGYIDLLFTLLIIIILIDQPNVCWSRMVDKKIYHQIPVQNFCFLRFNATNQIGCSDSKFGNEGLIKIINNDNDLNEIKNGHMAYVPVITSKQFNYTTLMAFKKSDNVAGVIVCDNGRPEWGFSSDHSCPNQLFDLYTNDNEYGFCRKIQWNKPNKQHYDNGLLFEHWPFPIFFIRNQNDIDWLLNKTDEHQNWPKLAAEFTAQMHGAVDSITCTRRSILSQNSWFSLMPTTYCEPLGGINIYTHTFDLNNLKTIPDNSVIVLSTRLDTFSMFDQLAPGADSVMSSLITTLAIAQLLYRPEIQTKLINTINQRSLLIALFDGEAFDYIGSSSAAFQMKNQIFPLPRNNSVEKSLQFNIDKIYQWIEFEQIGPHEISDKLDLYLHKNPGTTDSQQLINIIQMESKNFNDLQINETPNDMPLPPSSIQSFLKMRKNIEHVVVTNHRNEFINKYYNSFFDDGSDIMNSKDFKQSYLQRIKSIATLYSRVIYRSLTNEQLDLKEEASDELISMLMECFLYNSNCKLFSIILQSVNKTIESNDDDDENNQIEPPYPSYVSVYQADPRTKILRQYIKRILNYYSGQNMNVSSSDECISMARSDHVSLIN